MSTAKYLNTSRQQEIKLGEDKTSFNIIFISKASTYGFHFTPLPPLGYLELQKYAIVSGPMLRGKLFWVKNKLHLLWAQNIEV